MDTSTAISVYEHFLYIDESLKLSVDDYPEINPINDDTEFTYYDFVFKDYLGTRLSLHESNITNLDAHYILKKFVETLINSQSERTKSRLSKPFTYDDYLFLANEEEEDEFFDPYDDDFKPSTLDNINIFLEIGNFFKQLPSNDVETYNAIIGSLKPEKLATLNDVLAIVQ